MTRPVYPICPSFKDGELELNSIKKYLSYLEQEGATRVLTTAGTSQFNLLSVKEVFYLNRAIVKYFTKEKILGLPIQSLKHTLKEIKALNNLKAKNTSILIIFPERYYSDAQIINYFKVICNASNYPVYVHGNPIRKGNGGVYEYSNELLSKLSKIDNFKGMKEEYSSIDLAMKCIQDLDLDIIVAGGSMRRFWLLNSYGASSFLTGIGSFYPQYSEYFYDSIINNSLTSARSIMEKYEKQFFNVFMSIGWHVCMREGLKHKGFLLENREPFHNLDTKDIQTVIQTLKLLE
jgi:dihydrodipicolinate synthase/N-acetylneuraminate lyase